MDSDRQKCKTMQRYIYVVRKDVEEGRRQLFLPILIPVAAIISIAIILC